MKNIAIKAGKHLKSNAVKYTVVVGGAAMLATTYMLSVTVADMENFLAEKGLLDEWQNQPVA